MKPSLTALAALFILAVPGCMPGSAGSDGEVYDPPCEAPVNPCAGAMIHATNGAEVVPLAINGDFVAVCPAGRPVATACLTEDRAGIACNLSGSVVDGLPRCPNIAGAQSDVGTTGPTSPFLPALRVGALSDCERDCDEGKCDGPLVYTASTHDGDVQLRCDDTGIVREVLRPDFECAWAGTLLDRWGACDIPAPVFGVTAR